MSTWGAVPERKVRTGSSRAPGNSSRRQRPASAARAPAKNKKLRKREEGFNLRLNVKEDKRPVTEYNALFDNHLSHYFRNRRTQKFLFENGLIDRQGQIIDIERNKAKLYIIEQEFRNAERRELMRLKEEEEEKRRQEVLRKQQEEWERKKARIDAQRAARAARRQEAIEKGLTYDSPARAQSSGRKKRSNNASGSRGRPRTAGYVYSPSNSDDDESDEAYDTALQNTLRNIAKRSGQKPPKGTRPEDLNDSRQSDGDDVGGYEEVLEFPADNSFGRIDESP